MKKISLFLTCVLVYLVSFTASAQNPTVEFFTGKWNVLIKGAQGDVKLVFSLEKDSTTLKGVILDSTGKEQAKVDKVELGEQAITLFFVLMGYDLNMELKKKDDDHASGSLMGMFEVEADRVKTPKQLR